MGCVFRKSIKTLVGHKKGILAVSFSSDGKILASGSSDHTIKIWDVASGTLLKTLIGYDGTLRSFSFTPDGKSIVSGNVDGTIKFWDIAAGKESNCLTGHLSPIWSLSLSPDGKTLASASIDRTIKLWDVSTGKLLNILTNQGIRFKFAYFSPDGKVLASGGEDAVITFWDAPSISKQNNTIEYVNSSIMDELTAAYYEGGIMAAGRFYNSGVSAIGPVGTVINDSNNNAVSLQFLVGFNEYDLFDRIIKTHYLDKPLVTYYEEGVLKDLSSVSANLLNTLIEYLDNADSRKIAVYILGQIPDKNVIIPLIKTYNNKEYECIDIDIKHYIINSLVKFDDPAVKHMLRGAVKNNDSYLRSTAITGLIRMGYKERYFQDALIQLLKADLDIQKRQEVISVLGSYNSVQAVNALVPFLKDPDASIRQTIISSLSDKINDYPQIVAPLKVAVDDPDVFVRREAILSFGNYRDPSAVDIIKSRIHDEAIVKQAVVLSLGRQGRQEAIEPLRALLKDEEPFVRQTAILVFPKIPEAPILELTPYLSDPEWQVRQTAINSLSEFNRPEIIKAFIPLLKDDNVYVRQAVALSLGDKVKLYPQLQKEFINVLETDNDSWVKQVAAFSLQGVNTPEIERVMPLIRQTIPEVKVVVISPGINSPFLTTPARDLTQDASKDWQLRRILELGGVKVIEHRWSGRIWEMPSVQREFDLTEQQALNIAGRTGAVLNIGYSAGNIVNERLFAHLNPEMNTPISQAIKEGRIRIISLNSPSVYNFSKIDPNWKNFWADKDLISMPAAIFSPNQYDIKYNYYPDISSNRLELHFGYKDPRFIRDLVRQVYPQLSMPQLDKMIMQQNTDSWKYFPTRGNWPGQYNFESVAPANYYLYRGQYIPPQPAQIYEPSRYDFNNPLNHAPADYYLHQGKYEPPKVNVPSTWEYKPQSGSWPGQYNFKIVAPADYYLHQEQY
ncbi:MAG: HEAT repeat domain-containing protein, partial [Candidatus Omnitrophota bacterium]